MLTVSVIGLLIAFIFFGNLFSLVSLSTPTWILLIVLSLLTVVGFNLLYNIADKSIEKHKNDVKGVK